MAIKLHSETSDNMVSFTDGRDSLAHAVTLARFVRTIDATASTPALHVRSWSTLAAGTVTGATSAEWEDIDDDDDDVIGERMARTILLPVVSTLGLTPADVDAALAAISGPVVLGSVTSDGKLADVSPVSVYAFREQLVADMVRRSRPTTTGVSVWWQGEATFKRPNGVLYVATTRVRQVSADTAALRVSIRA